MVKNGIERELGRLDYYNSGLRIDVAHNSETTAININTYETARDIYSYCNKKNIKPNILCEQNIHQGPVR